MSPDNRLTLIEQREQSANAVRVKAYRKRRLQLLTLEDAWLLITLRELRTGEKAVDR